MNILEITFHLAPGGAERFAVDLSNELAKKHNVTHLVLRDDSIDVEFRNFYKNEVSDKVHYESLGLGNGLSPYMWWKIWRKIRELEPDVVHYHGDPMVYWMLPPILFSSSKIEFIQTIHSDFKWGGYDRWPYRILVTLCKSKFSFVALAQKNYNDLRQCYVNVRSTCIVNGRAPMEATSLFESVKSEINSFRNDNNTIVCLHVARCNEVKNQKRLIRCFNKLIENGENATLLIIGGGYDEQLGVEIKKMACNRIHFLGQKKNISDYQLNADLFCLSSDYEGMPITLIEAILSGVPIVSTPVCGALSSINNEVNGIIAKDFSDEEYLRALQKSFVQLDRLTSNAKALKNDNPYTIKNCAENYLNFFVR